MQWWVSSALKFIRPKTDTQIWVCGEKLEAGFIIHRNSHQVDCNEKPKVSCPHIHINRLLKANDFPWRGLNECSEEGSGEHLPWKCPPDPGMVIRVVGDTCFYWWWYSSHLLDWPLLCTRPAHKIQRASRSWICGVVWNFALWSVEFFPRQTVS